VAVNITEVPAHTVLAEAAMDTLAGNIGFTAIITEFDVAGLSVAQAALEVSTHFTTSLFEGVYVYVALFVPALTSLTFH